MIFRTEQQEFHLSTADTSYIFRVMETGQLEHLYYGRQIPQMERYDFLYEKCNGFGLSVAYDQKHQSTPLENIQLEYSAYGKGDYKAPALQTMAEDGCFFSDFKFEKAVVTELKPKLKGLPSSYGDHVETLIVTMADAVLGAKLELYYSVFEKSNVITRSVRFMNLSKSPIKLHNIMSMQVDLNPGNYTMLTFDGAWIREREKHEKPLSCGEFSISSNVGTSSCRHNPFFAIREKDCTELSGNCYGFNLVYSGNHLAKVDVSPHEIVRVQNGINPFEFEWLVEPNASFDAPESVMTFSHKGLNGMSQNMHSFVRNHIVRGTWQFKERPVLVNNWEATYFNFNEKKIVSIAKAAKELGAEMFVLDDGWFGKRNNDRCSLGDWVVNRKKLPTGMDGLCKKINQLGMKFGLWVEPEMVSPNSDLFREHPDWAVASDKYTPSQGRSQLVLDLTRLDVCQFLIDAMTKVFSLANIEYIKWDMNRFFSDVFSRKEGARQGEFFHRYTMGLYYILDALVSRFPDILFESCSSGGNRFDLGMFCYMPQTWCSDDTDSLERVKIQAGTSYGYPLSCIAAHVSGSISSQAFRPASIENRFNVASFGLMGYEMDVTKLTHVDKAAVKKQIKYYKERRRLFQFGDFYRLTDTFTSNVTLWEVVSEDKSQAVLFQHQKLSYPNPPSETIKFVGLDEMARYQLRVRSQQLNIKIFTEIICSGIPLTIDPDGGVINTLTDNVALRTEKDAYEMLPGSALMFAGFKPKRLFSGSGYNFDTKMLLDNDSRLYEVTK